MKKYILISILFGFAVGYLTFIGLDEFSEQKNNHEQMQYSIDVDHANHTDMMHEHQLIEVDTVSIPTLALNVQPDEKSGYNIQIITDNYRWSPASVNGEPIQNQGHAHVYVNHEKVARVYGEWFHLDAHHLFPVENILRVTLNADNHDEWSVSGTPIEVIMNLNEFN